MTNSLTLATAHDGFPAPRTRAFSTVDRYWAAPPVSPVSRALCAGTVH